MRLCHRHVTTFFDLIANTMCDVVLTGSAFAGVQLGLDLVPDHALQHRDN